MSNIVLKGIKAAAELVNLTPYVINTYDKSSGEILTLLPKIQELPTEPIEDDNIYYIVTRSDAKRLKNIRPLDDIAIIRCIGRGRGNKRIAYFAWGGDTQKEVCLYCSRYTIVDQ